MPLVHVVHVVAVDHVDAVVQENMRQFIYGLQKALAGRIADYFIICLHFFADRIEKRG